MKILDKYESIVRRAKAIGYGEVKSAMHPFDTHAIHGGLPPKVRKLFDDGHYSEATFEACKFFEKKIAVESGISDIGFSLMMKAFNEASPKIVASLLDGASGENEQGGIKHICAGIMRAVRNPKGHEHSIQDSPDACVDHLSMISAMMRHIEQNHGDLF